MKRTILSKIRQDKILILLRKLLKDFEDVYLVGGAIRDYGLGFEPKEYDFAVKEPRKIAAFVSQKFEMNYFKLGKNLDNVYRIPIGEGGIDFGALGNQTIEENLGKRDFTIDSIAIDLASHKVYDPFGGFKDIKGRIIRITGEEAFKNDPLRILKGYRLKCAFSELYFDRLTEKKIRENAHLLENVAPERIKMEISKILSSKKCLDVIAEMSSNDVLFTVFPLLIKLKDVPQSFPHKSDVLSHTFDMLKFLDENIDLTHILSLWSNSSENIMKMRFAIVFHDAGKKDTFSEDRSGIHFHKHEKISARIAQKSLSKLRYSNKIIKDVVSLCELHMRPLLLFKEKKCSITAKRRLIKESGDNFPLLILLSFIDFSTMKRDEKEIVEYHSFCEEMFSLYQEVAKEIKAPPKLVDGLEAMEILQLKEKGPELGNALKLLREQQIDGNIKNKEEAVAFLKKYRKNILDKK